jgi:hypothetical protein
MLKAITRLQLNRIKKRVESTHKVAFDYDDAVVDLIVSRCTETESGGRRRGRDYRGAGRKRRCAEDRRADADAGGTRCAAGAAARGAV